MKARILLAIFVLGVLGACATTNPSTETAPASQSTVREPDPAVVKRGREWTRQFYDRELDSLWSQMNEQMTKALRSVDELAKFRQHIGDQLGDEAEVLSEQTMDTGGAKIYLRKVTFSRSSTPALIQWAIDSDGKITGFFIQPAQ